jgi:hypothetical protein
MVRASIAGQVVRKTVPGYWTLPQLQELESDMRKSLVAGGKALAMNCGTRARPIPERELRLLMQRAAKRCRYRGQEFPLTYEQMKELAKRCRGACEISGIPFSYKKGPHFRRPYTPTLDRISNDRGYEFDNVRMVCSAVNYALNEWGEEIFFNVVRSTFATKHRKGLASQRWERYPTNFCAPSHPSTGEASPVHAVP